MKFQWERKGFDKDVIGSFNVVLPSLVERCENKDIYHMDESRLLWKAASDKNLTPKGSDCARRTSQCHYVVTWLRILRNRLHHVILSVCNLIAMLCYLQLRLHVTSMLFYVL